MIVTITGKNDYMAKAELTKMVKAHVSTYGDISLHRFDAEELEIDQLNNAALSIPFLAAQTMVVLKGIAGVKDLHDELIQLTEKIPATTKLIIYEPKLDRRSALYKVLKSKSQFQDFEPLNEPALINWVEEEFKDLGSSIDRRLARYLVQRVGENQWQLKMEIDKLAAFTTSVSEAIINQSVEPHPRETIFQLLDAVADSQPNKTIELYRKLIQAQLEPAYILSMIIWQLHNMSIVVTAGQRTDSDIASDFSMSPYVVSKTRQATRGMNKKSINYLWGQVISVDEQIKSSAVNAELLIEQLLVKMTTSLRSLV